MLVREVNFYLLLELPLNPPEENEEIILAAINKKRSLWSSMINHPTKKNEARQNLEMLPSIKAIMLEDKTKRQKEAKKAKDIKEKEILIKKNKLIKIVKIISLKGYISKEELKKIKNEFTELGENFINKAIGKVQVRDTFYNENNKLDSVIYNKIRDNLEIIGKDTLYEFLGLPENSSLEELKRSSKSVYESLRKITKKDSKVTARGELQGFCDIVFKDLKSKKEYDNKIKNDKLKDIEEIIEVCRSKRFITSEEFLGLIVLIKSRGFNEKECEEYLFNYCIKNRICVIYKEALSLNKNIYSSKESNVNKNNEVVQGNVLKKGEAYIEEIEIPPEVYDVKIKAGYKFIEVKYKAPVEAIGIKVWRKEGKLPKAYGDGFLLRNVTLTGFKDDNLKDNTDYGYLICVQYKDSGTILHSSGVCKYGVTDLSRDKHQEFGKEKNSKNPNNRYEKKEEKNQSFWESLFNWNKN